MSANLYKRSDGRLPHELRTIKVTHDMFGYAAGSVLFQMGQTKVLCSVTMHNGVPPFLKGKKSGWVTAEYAMIPTATKQRTQRESTAHKQQGRSIEISRLISRVLRAVIDLDSLGERTITVDCDVLQADGGTRAAAITGACLALQRAQQQWLDAHWIERPFLKELIAAVSAGVMDGKPLLDLNFVEDSAIDADFNFILTQSGNIVEIQGTAERAPLSWQSFEELKKMAVDAMAQIFAQVNEKNEMSDSIKIKKSEKVPIFSLQKRLSNSLKQLD